MTKGGKYQEKLKMKVKRVIGIFGLISAFSSVGLCQEEADSLSLGVPLNLSKIGEPYIADRIGNWSLECVRGQDGSETCEMTQLLLNKQKQPMSEISLFRLTNDQGIAAGANIVVPLETLLTIPLTISFDEKNVKQYPYSFCNAIGCIVRIGLTGNEINILKKGKQANISVTHISRPNQPITFSMSLKGFTAAFERTSILKN
jgi:invasion protein IalB